MTKLLLFLVALSAPLVYARTFNLTLFQPSIVNGTELKAGSYKLELKEEKAVIRSGKQAVEATVKVESAENKFSSTSVRYENGDGKYRVQEIRLGGTNMKLIFNN
jgi:hypothetical protein